VTLYVVRHAHAGDRGSWVANDDERPLSLTGRGQAAGLAGLLSTASIERVLSSPSVRCVQTVEPLAERRQLPVDVDKALAEGAWRAAVDLVWSLAGTEAVLCTHGDVIPEVLDAVAQGGVRIADALRWEKGSVWALHTVDGRFTHATYTRPPQGEAGI
jgi:phosphohistidine phosphatase SixA